MSSLSSVKMRTSQACCLLISSSCSLGKKSPLAAWTFCRVSTATIGSGSDSAVNLSGRISSTLLSRFRNVLYRPNSSDHSKTTPSVPLYFCAVSAFKSLIWDRFLSLHALACRRFRSFISSCLDVNFFVEEVLTITFVCIFSLINNFDNPSEALPSQNIAPRISCN